MQQDLEKAGLIIAPEKVQMQAPYSYLGYQLAMDGIKPKKLTINTSHLKTLHNWQQLLGDVQWIRPSLAIKTGDLRPLYDMLLGDPDPASPRILTPAARQALRLLLDNIERVHLQQKNDSCRAGTAYKQ